MAKLLLIDGSNLLFQMFFGMPAREFSGRTVGRYRACWGLSARC